MLSSCARPQPIEAMSDPVTKPLPSSSVAPEVTGQACEPIVECGVWSGCVWLDRLDGDRYRARSGDRKGSIFVRRHECWPGDAGTAGCAMYCRSPGACVDGLHPETETCTGAAVPTPTSTPCLIGAGICGSLM